MKKCKYCLCVIDKNTTICPNCHKKQKSFGKRIFLAVSVLVILLSVCIVAFIILNKNRRDTYNTVFLSNISIFQQNYLKDSIVLESVGNDIQKYWHDHIWNKKYDSIEDAVEKALEKNKSEIDRLKDNNTNIRKKYLEIRNASCYNKYCDELKNEIKSTYDIYSSLYKLITYPTGNYNSFIDKFNSLDSQLANKYNAINDLIELFKTNN